MKRFIELQWVYGDRGVIGTRKLREGNIRHHFICKSMFSHSHTLELTCRGSCVDRLLASLLQLCDETGCGGQVRELRKRTECLPDDYWVVLAGDMITEEALPTYMAMLNTLDGVRDETVRLAASVMPLSAVLMAAGSLQRLPHKDVLMHSGSCSDA